MSKKKVLQNTYYQLGIGTTISGAWHTIWGTDSTVLGNDGTPAFIWPKLNIDPEGGRLSNKLAMLYADLRFTIKLDLLSQDIPVPMPSYYRYRIFIAKKRTPETSLGSDLPASTSLTSIPDARFWDIQFDRTFKKQTGFASGYRTAGNPVNLFARVACESPATTHHFKIPLRATAICKGGINEDAEAKFDKDLFVFICFDVGYQQNYWGQANRYFAVDDVFIKYFYYSI